MARSLTRGARRREQTIHEIVDHAVAVMDEVGVAGLSMSEVARRVGIRPPSLYKYFPSRLALFDRLFRDGQQANLDAFRAGADTATAPGLNTLTAALEASGRWALANQSLAKLLFSRPVPGFEPSAEAFAPSLAMVADVQQMLRDAVELGELKREAAGPEGLSIVSILTTGVLSQQLSNEPDAGYDDGRYTRLAPRLFAMFTKYYEVP
jgi:AcrR family transcriptional regulator